MGREGREERVCSAMINNKGEREEISLSIHSHK